jgi:transcriptional regulator with XRE-family HTH domain
MHSQARKTTVHESGDEGPRSMSVARRRRRRKAIYLPQIAQLALEGHTGRAIATELGLPPRTVSQWLHEMRSEWLAAAKHGGDVGPDMTAASLARLNRIYCKAMKAWRRAKAGIRPRALSHVAAAEIASRRRRPALSSFHLIARGGYAVGKSLRFLGHPVADPEPLDLAEALRSAEALEDLTEQELVGLYSLLKIRREQASFDPKSPGPSFIIGETWPS